MSKVFKYDMRPPKMRPGARQGDRPGWVDVKAGDTPEQHGLDPKDVEKHLKDDKKTDAAPDKTSRKPRQKVEGK